MEQSPVETKPKKSAWRKALRGAKKNGDKERRKARQGHKGSSSRLRHEEEDWISLVFEDAASADFLTVEWQRVAPHRTVEERRGQGVVVALMKMYRGRKSRAT